MSTLGNRRRLVHSSHKHAPSVLVGAALLDLLDRTDAVPRVGIILEKYLEIETDQHRRLIHQFNQQLLKNVRGGYDPDFFWHHHSQQDADASLEQYLVEEFVASTNYQAYRLGRERNLELNTKSLNFAPSRALRYHP
jgi:hypothetical protein